MANDHFVPRHYLRQFTINESEYIAVANVSPYKFIGSKGIGGQCCEDDFYENNNALNKLLGVSENDLAPVLVRVIKNQDFDTKEINALKMLAVFLNVRTKKAIEAAKVFPKHIAKAFIESAIKQGKLPPLPEGNSLDEAIDFKNVAGVLMQQMIPCWMETQTLSAKLLKAQNGTCFITSDNPVVVLNQFALGADPMRSFAGFSQSGFQLLMPISPNLCLIIYDAKVYKVGSRRHRLIEISKADVEITNSLQVQSADNCLFFHEPKMEQEVQNLVARYANLRIPLRDFLETFPGKDKTEEIIKVSNETVKLPKVWNICSYRRHIKYNPGDRRDPAWTALADQLMKDFDQNPDGGDVFARLEKITLHNLSNLLPQPSLLATEKENHPPSP
jgi:hypothetical protein